MDLVLDAKEMELLRRVLQHTLEDLRREIHHTDSRAFRSGLRSEETAIHRLLDRMKDHAVVGL